MRDAQFRSEQVNGLRDSHVAAINALVDDLCDVAAGLWAPYVAPMYGGVDARLLSVLRDPGPKTHVDHGGSGFLCMENDDATAEKLCGLFAGAEIAASDIVPWNSYPWYINAKPTVRQLQAGVAPLLDLITLMPRLKVVLLLGGSAQAGWRQLSRRNPDMAGRFTVIETYHKSRQAFWHRDPAVRTQRAEHLVAAFSQAAEALAA